MLDRSLISHTVCKTSAATRQVLLPVESLPNELRLLAYGHDQPVACAAQTA
jgi:hypothetical protein